VSSALVLSFILASRRELSLSVKTVSEYRSRLLAKMKLKTSAELTHYAIRNQLID